VWPAVYKLNWLS